MWNYLHNTNISSSDKTSTHRGHVNHIREVTRHSGLSNMLSKWWELLDQGLKSNLPSINKNLESSIINIDTYIIANFPLLETFTDFDQHAWSKSVKVSSKSGKPFPRYCRLKPAKNNDHIGQYRAAGETKSQRQMKWSSLAPGSETKKGYIYQNLIYI